jgi:hypothetical protein
MLDLASPRWADLDPELPPLIAALPEQRAVARLSDRLRVGDGLHPAAYAVLPHLVTHLAVERGPEAVSMATLAARIELARQRPDPPAMPADLAGAYEVGRANLLPACLALAAAEPRAVPVAAAAVALGSGEHVLAEAYLLMTPAEADAFLLWAKAR